MFSSVQDLKSLAASGGTDSITVPVSSTGAVPDGLMVGLAVKYAAVQTTSGCSVSFQVSQDGINFVNSAMSGFTVSPAANVLGFGEKQVFLAGPLKLDSGPIVAVKVTVTNNDAANAALVALVV